VVSCRLGPRPGRCEFAHRMSCISREARAGGQRSSEPCSPRQPVWAQVVTHVIGRFCHRCVRAGPAKKWRLGPPTASTSPRPPYGFRLSNPPFFWLTLRTALWVAALEFELALGRSMGHFSEPTAQFDANPLGLWLRDAVLQQLASEFAAGVHH